VKAHADHAHSHDDHAHASAEGRVARWADRIGAVVGFLCAIHCAAVPILLGLAPAMGLGFLKDEALEWGLLATAAVVASVAFIHAVRRRHPRYILVGLASGLALLVAGAVFEEHEIPSTILSVAGGVVLAVSHLKNSRCHRAACDHP
jgi:hypothetical protein